MPTNGRLQLCLSESTGSKQVCEFDFGTLEFSGQRKLSPKAAQVFWLLCRHAGETVSKDQLLDEVWAGQPRVPDVLVQAVAEIRRGLGDDLRAGLRTIPKHGYRMELQAKWIASAASESPGRPAASASAAGARRWPALAAIGAVLLILAVTLSSQRAPAPVSADTPLTVHSGERLSFEPGPDRQPALNPQGTLLAYVRPMAPGAAWKVHLRPLGSAEPARRLSRGDAANELQPAWSNRGDRLAWLRIGDESCHFVVMVLATGEQTEHGDCFHDIAPAFAWTPDDRALLITDRMESSQRALHLVLLDLETGQRRLLAYPRAEQQADYSPRLSPDGGRWAFLRSARQATELWLMNVDGSDSRQVARFASGVAGYDWLADGSGWLVVGSGEPARPWWQVAVGGSMRSIRGPDLVQPRRAAQGSRWVAEEPAGDSHIWQGSGSDVVLRAPGEAGQDLFPTPHPRGGLLFVSTRRGQSELWWQSEESGAPQPQGSAADAFGRPVWADNDAVLVPVRRDELWQVERLSLADGRLQRFDSAPYQLTELAKLGAQWFAIGSLLEHPGQTELLTLELSPSAIRVESTGVAAIAVRAGEGELWIRQYLLRGVRQVDPDSLKLSQPIGTEHFLDWRVERGGLLFWRRRDLLRHELVWIDPRDPQTERIELAADESVNPYAGLARTAKGELLTVRQDADAGDLHALELNPTESTAKRATP